MYKMYKLFLCVSTALFTCFNQYQHFLIYLVDLELHFLHLYDSFIRVANLTDTSAQLDKKLGKYKQHLPGKPRQTKCARADAHLEAPHLSILQSLFSTAPVQYIQILVTQNLFQIHWMNTRPFTPKMIFYLETLQEYQQLTPLTV